MTTQEQAVIRAAAGYVDALNAARGQHEPDWMEPAKWRTELERAVESWHIANAKAGAA